MTLFSTWVLVTVLVVVVLVLVGAGLCRGEDDVFTGSLDPTGFSPAVHYTSKRETTHTHIKNIMIRLKRFKFYESKIRLQPHFQYCCVQFF